MAGYLMVSYGLCLGIWIWSYLSTTQGRTIPIRKRATFYIANETVCVVDNQPYYNGDPIPTDDPCESCKCRPPGFACVLHECEKKIGCREERKQGQCCPEYTCGCHHNGKLYEDGEQIKDEKNPCYTCYCQGTSIACAFVDCSFRNDCAPLYVSGECCPNYDHCPPLEPIYPNGIEPSTHNPQEILAAREEISEENRPNLIPVVPEGLKQEDITTKNDEFIPDQATPDESPPLHNIHTQGDGEMTHSPVTKSESNERDKDTALLYMQSEDNLKMKIPNVDNLATKQTTVSTNAETDSEKIIDPNLQGISLENTEERTTYFSTNSNLESQRNPVNTTLSEITDFLTPSTQASLDEKIASTPEDRNGITENIPRESVPRLDSAARSEPAEITQAQNPTTVMTQVSAEVKVDNPSTLAHNHDINAVQHARESTESNEKKSGTAVHTIGLDLTKILDPNQYELEPSSLGISSESSRLTDFTSTTAASEHEYLTSELSIQNRNPDSKTEKAQEYPSTGENFKPSLLSSDVENPKLLIRYDDLGTTRLSTTTVSDHTTGSIEFTSTEKSQSSNETDEKNSEDKDTTHTFKSEEKMAFNDEKLETKNEKENDQPGHDYKESAWPNYKFDETAESVYIFRDSELQESHKEPETQDSKHKESTNESVLDGYQHTTAARNEPEIQNSKPVKSHDSENIQHDAQASNETEIKNSNESPDDELHQDQRSFEIDIPVPVEVTEYGLSKLKGTTVDNLSEKSSLTTISDIGSSSDKEEKDQSDDSIIIEKTNKKMPIENSEADKEQFLDETDSKLENEKPLSKHQNVSNKHKTDVTTTDDKLNKNETLDSAHLSTAAESNPTTIISNSTTIESPNSTKLSTPPIPLLYSKSNTTQLIVSENASKVAENLPDQMNKTDDGISGNDTGSSMSKANDLTNASESSLNSKHEDSKISSLENAGSNETIMHTEKGNISASYETNQTFKTLQTPESNHTNKNAENPINIGSNQTDKPNATVSSNISKAVENQFTESFLEDPKLSQESASDKDRLKDSNTELFYSHHEDHNTTDQHVSEDLTGHENVDNNTEDTNTSISEPVIRLNYQPFLEEENNPRSEHSEKSTEFGVVTQTSIVTSNSVNQEVKETTGTPKEITPSNHFSPQEVQANQEDISSGIANIKSDVQPSHGTTVKTDENKSSNPVEVTIRNNDTKYINIFLPKEVEFQKTPLYKIGNGDESDNHRKNQFKDKNKGVRLTVLSISKKHGSDVEEITFSKKESSSDQEAKILDQIANGTIIASSSQNHAEGQISNPHNEKNHVNFLSEELTNSRLRKPEEQKTSSNSEQTTSGSSDKHSEETTVVNQSEETNLSSQGSTKPAEQTHNPPNNIEDVEDTKVTPQAVNIFLESEINRHKEENQMNSQQNDTIQLLEKSEIIDESEKKLLPSEVSIGQENNQKYFQPSDLTKPLDHSEILSQQGESLLSSEALNNQNKNLTNYPTSVTDASTESTEISEPNEKLTTNLHYRDQNDDQSAENIGNKQEEKMLQSDVFVNQEQNRQNHQSTGTTKHSQDTKLETHSKVIISPSETTKLESHTKVIINPITEKPDLFKQMLENFGKSQFVHIHKLDTPAGYMSSDNVAPGSEYKIQLDEEPENYELQKESTDKLTFHQQSITTGESSDQKPIAKENVALKIPNESEENRRRDHTDISEESTFTTSSSPLEETPAAFVLSPQGSLPEEIFLYPTHHAKVPTETPKSRKDNHQQSGELKVTNQHTHQSGITLSKIESGDATTRNREGIDEKTSIDDSVKESSTLAF